MDVPKEIFLKDYKAPDYYFDTVDLQFQLGEEKTIVTSKIVVSPGVEGISAPLVLHGHDLKLISIKVNGTELKGEEYKVNSRHLMLSTPPAVVFNLEIVTEIYPQLNTSLEGLYKSTGNFCTQCEAEGFRKITYFQDRPDVMAKYTCRIEADKTLYPVLLSNGNLIEQGDLEGGKHYALWEDPFKKPSYLFALVAGQLGCREDSFVTCSGRNVTLRIWTPAQDLPKTAHAMYSLKAAMKWDEEVFGLEYDLDLFNIVVVPDFNMGAMENKSLNIFQSRLVLASPETATDGDYAAILGVVGHEYFHNWTGNRVTCRDWFQLTLKEGLTVFRDQEFSSDLGCRTVKRIADVSKLRIYQFPQDAGPMAHPIRPHSYIKMDNFYTVTVYEKGAEVVRMYKTMFGASGFRKGMDLYFKRHDGQAVTCEDFYAAMCDANNAQLPNFLQWYSQAGTPIVKVASSYDPSSQTFSLKLSQEVPPTPGQPVKEPMFIPVAVGLVDSTGKDMPLTSVYSDGSLQTVSTDGQPVFTTVLQFKFNFYINSMYEAIATAMEMIQGTSAAMVADFLSEGDEKKRLMELAIGLTSLSGIIILGFTAALVVPILSAVLVASWNYFILGATALGTGIQTAWLWLTTASAESAVAAAETTEVATSTAATTASKEAAEATEVSALKGEQAALTGGSKLQKRSPKHHHTITHDRYQMWSSLNTYLQQMQDRLQAIISVTANLAIYSPISSQEGLYGALQNGTFLSDHPPKATLVDSARETVQLGTLAQLFRTMNIIFVIDSNPCKQEGPTTPLKHPEAVHFCNSDGVKTSLGMVKTKKIDYEIRNGRLLFSKYGFSTELLYQLAADCQTQRKNLNLTATNGLLTMANNGSDFLQNMIKNGSNLENSMNTFNLTSPGENGVPINPINQDPKSSTILLPDGTSICSFPIPICDLRSPEIKSHISAGDSPAKACQQSLGLPDVDF